MYEHRATAPTCIVLGCDQLSALTDVTEGRYWGYLGHYCAGCYLELTEGRNPEIDVSRLTVVPASELERLRAKSE